MVITPAFRSKRYDVSTSHCHFQGADVSGAASDWSLTNMKMHFDSSTVRERDLDLLLLEEMYVSAPFRLWIVEKLRLPLDAEYAGGRHMVSAAFGESDIELDFATEAGIHRVLIENKIDARFQLDQAERYKKRADFYVREKQECCTHCQTVLFAPRAYATRRGSEFDGVLLYEELQDWYQQQGTSDGRARWKTALLDTAIKKHHAVGKKSSGKPIDERLSKFWFAYWTMASQNFPELGMLEPFDKVGGFNHLFPTSLLQGVGLVHRVRSGRVELQFGGLSGKAGEAEIRSLFGLLLDLDMAVRGTGENVMVGLKAPSLNKFSDFFQQTENARVGMEAATRLAKWLEENGSIWQGHLDTASRSADAAILVR
jgi:hypothetical protein